MCIFVEIHKMITELGIKFIFNVIILWNPDYYSDNSVKLFQ